VKLSVLIPAHNEAASITDTVCGLASTLEAAQIAHEILVVEDHSTDGTADVLEQLTNRVAQLRWVSNPRPPGFGYAIRSGLEVFAGDAVCIVMADASDDPRDVVTYYGRLQTGVECVFGSRFAPGAEVRNYPWLKLGLNRLTNIGIALLFGSRYTDWTNAFKCYRREVIDGVQPILACHFNLTVELPLKAMVRGYSYAIVPTNWYGRKAGVSKLKIKEMGSRYAFIILYVLLERWLTRGDYYRARRTRQPLNS
jgi:dolichol-phosphate mannosyltransferase